MSLNQIDIKYFKLAVGLENIGKETSSDISARCPVCGDSKIKKHSKRLHLYNKNSVTNVSCFNGDCPVVNKTVYSFLRDFYPAFLSKYKNETFGSNLAILANRGDETDVFAQFKKNPDIKETSKAQVTTYDLSPYLKNIHDSNEGLLYIENRGFNYNEQFGQWYFGYQDLNIDNIVYKITNSIIIPLYYKDEMYGFYSRNIWNKFFQTYMNPVNTGYKVWNWFNINKEKPVYIFEGVFDAIASGLNNVIALLGAKLPQERLNELKYPIFVLDNDKTGKYNSLQYAQAGYDVYVQPNKLKEKDINEILLNHKNINIPKLIKDNIYSNIIAVVEIQNTL